MPFIRSWRSPVLRSFQVSLVAMRRLRPEPVRKLGFPAGAQVSDQHDFVEATVNNVPHLLALGPTDGASRIRPRAVSPWWRRLVTAPLRSRSRRSVGKGIGQRGKVNDHEVGHFQPRFRAAPRWSRRIVEQMNQARKASAVGRVHSDDLVGHAFGSKVLVLGIDRIVVASAETATSRAAIAGISARLISRLKPSVRAPDEGRRQPSRRRLRRAAFARLGLGKAEHQPQRDGGHEDDCARAAQEDIGAMPQADGQIPIRGIW